MIDSWIQALTIIGANFGFMLAMFLWLRAEANADRRDLSNQFKSDRSENIRMIFDLTNTLIAESKEFHGRLVEIEQKNKK